MFKKHACKAASILGMVLTLALFLPKLALADDDDDPPSVVARLAYTHGAVSFQPGGTDDWVDAVLNRPVTTGDKLWSDTDGRAELQLDASTIRLSNTTGFSFLNLSDNVTQIRLTEGNILVRVRQLEDNETYEIDTPNLAFSITKPGTYRVSVNEGGDATEIKVRSGEGDVTGGGTSYSVRANDDANFTGTDELNADVQDLSGENDDFDNWSASRDHRGEHSASAQYVSPDVVGYEDLDDHGTWRDSPDYGHVWYPQVTVLDWAPYHYGHWSYIEPWGYTWVDDQPWGFAPFHYGRWVNVEGRWGWIPSPPRAQGVVYVRPVYAPALVAFVGGAGFSVGVAVGGGGGAVGWFPLGPREVYVPSYRVSQRYVERVNVSNTRVTTTVVNNYYNTTVVNNTRVTNVTYVNQRVPGAVMATSQQAFTSAQPVSRNVVKVDQRQIASAQVEARQPAYVPTKQAVLGSARPAVRQPPAALQSRTVVAKAAPPPPPPSFEKRQEAIKSNGGRPLSAAQVRQIQPAPAQRQVAVKVAPAPKQPPVPVRQAPRPQTPAQGGVANRPGQPQNNPADRPAAVAPNASQPANRPATPTPNAAPTNRPADRSVTQPNAAPPANRPADRPSNDRPPNATQPNRPAERPAPPAAQPTNRPAEKPSDRPATRPTEPAPKPAERPAPAPKPAERPAPADRPAERPAARPAERPQEKQKEQPKEKEKPPKDKEKDKDKDKEKPPKG
jgi:FecR protein